MGAAEVSPGSRLDAGAYETIRRVWGHERLRPLQREAIEASLSKRDSLVVMPTGGGKSLCYQVPPLLAGRLDVVVSPLISLMKDQVDGLRACGYPAAAIHAHVSAPEKRSITEGLRRGEYRLLLVSPERLMTEPFLALLGELEVRAFAVDEAHCISHWGHDFRPEYRKLAALKVRFPDTSVHAFTATATPRVRQDIVEQLRLTDPNVLVGVFDRANLVYRVVQRVDTAAQVAEVLRRHTGEAAIVYCLSRADTERLADSLNAQGIEAQAYHAGMDGQARRRTQDAFAAETLDVVVATIAFGMGIDRSNVRCVIHATMPQSVEHYQQETGRAGRDGLEAECVLLYSPEDVFRWRSLIERSSQAKEEDPLRRHPRPQDAHPGSPPQAGEGSGGGERKRDDAATGDTSPGERLTATPVDEGVVAARRQLLWHMQNLCRRLECRHRALSRYFGQDYEADNCGACDVCLGEVEAMPDSSMTAQKIISCVARVEQRFGVGHVVQVLRGAASEQVVRWAHDRVSTYGLLREMSQRKVTNLVYQLVDQGLLDRTEGDRPVVQLNARSIEVLRGERSVQLLDAEEGSVVRSRAAAESWEGVDRDLFEHLRTLRRRLATERGVPAYVIFGDTTLRDLARIRPTEPEAMAAVHGVGKKKLADLGPVFMDAIRSYLHASA